ncbi:MAG: glycosyltransferase [Anaerolineae bacterium]|nr:MAG: glycosyltransferase [Anaerolineae bacterium]
MVNKTSVSFSLPPISVIIPSLNQGAFIEYTIRSLLDQNYPNLEIIVCDGMSTDTTISILRKWQNYIKWVSERDSGQSEAINKGLKWSKGEILAYLNADDCLLPGSLSRIALAFEKNQQAMWLTGQCQIINTHGRRIRFLIEQYKNFFLRYLPYIKALYITNYISQPATFWKRSAWERVGDFNPTLRYVMDYDYWIRLWQEFGPPLIIHQPLASFRIHETSKTTSEGHAMSYVKEEESILQKHRAPRLFYNLHRVHRLAMTHIYHWMNS